MAGIIMESVFDMSIVGIYVIAVVMLARLALLKCGRKYAYWLWLIVFLNLCIPINLQGRFSLIPQRVADFSIREQVQEINTVEQTWNFMLPATEMGQADIVFDSTEPVNRQSLFSQVAFYIWLLGIVTILLYNLLRICKLQKQLRADKITMLDEKRKIVKCEKLSTPFLWGVIHPTIYLPEDLTGKELEYIVAHEECHRCRRDYMFKMVVFIIAVIHWFNPIVWIAYAMFCRDMEISCDEAVLSHAENNIKKPYAESLLRYAAKQNGYMPAPLTFAEPSVKSRIKNVLNFRKKGVVVSVIALVCVIGVVIGLLIRPTLKTEWNHYTGYGVSFDYPKEWIIKEQAHTSYGTAKELFQTVSVAPVEYDITQFVCSRYTVENYDFSDEEKNASYDLDITEEQMIENLEYLDVNAEFVESKDVMIGDYPAKKVTYTADYNKYNQEEAVRVVTSRYAVNVGECGYQFVVNCELQDAEKMQNMFDEMIASISFED